MNKYYSYEDMILNFLKENHVGREQGIKAIDLADHFGITTRALRLVKVNIVKDLDSNVGSTTKYGYFYAKDESDNIYFMNEYISRGDESFIMANAYKEGLVEKDQLELDV